jgi:hypothetical protein
MTQTSTGETPLNVDSQLVVRPTFIDCWKYSTLNTSLDDLNQSFQVLHYDIHIHPIHLTTKPYTNILIVIIHFGNETMIHLP